VKHRGDNRRKGPPFGQRKPYASDRLRLTTRRHHNQDRAHAGIPGTPDPPLSATTARRQPPGRNRLQAPTAYPGGAQAPSRAAGAFAGKGIPAEPLARRSEIGCSTLQP
jgi:hypothetical protein